MAPPTAVVDLEFSPSLSVVRTARDAANVLASHIPADTLDDVRLLTSELVTNSVKHAGLDGADRIRLRLLYGQGRIHVEVRDPGSGMAGRTIANDPLRESGWGLYLLDQISDRWGTSDDGEACAWFELDVA
jgi:anti-sigma regulatory factor (Ser/Thr protein kinase)